MFRIISLALMLLPFQANAQVNEANSCINSRGSATGMRIYNICDRSVWVAYCAAGPGVLCSRLDQKTHLSPGESYGVGGHNVSVRHNACFGRILKVVDTRIACEESR